MPEHMQLLSTILSTVWVFAATLMVLVVLCSIIVERMDGRGDD